MQRGIFLNVAVADEDLTGGSCEPWPRAARLIYISIVVGAEPARRAVKVRNPANTIVEASEQVE